MADRYERLWRDYWRQTHQPDQNGEYYFDRHDREDREKAAAAAERPKSARPQGPDQ